MKKQLLAVFVGAGVGLAVLLVAQPSSAEPIDEAIARIPFQFVAGNAVLPAGTYMITADSGDPAVLQFVSSDGRHVSFVATNWGGRENDSSRALFQFKKYGDEYLLSAVAMPGEDARDVELPRAQVDRDLVKAASINYRAEHHPNG